jgi:hypothetical protein
MERDIQPSFPFQEKTESSILRSIYLIPKDESIKNIKYTVTQRARGLGKSHAVVACEWVGDKAWKISLPGLVWQIPPPYLCWTGRASRLFSHFNVPSPQDIKGSSEKGGCGRWALTILRDLSKAAPLEKCKHHEGRP